MQQPMQLQPHFESTCSLNIGMHAGSNDIKPCKEHKSEDARELSGGKLESPLAPLDQQIQNRRQTHPKSQSENLGGFSVLEPLGEEDRGSSWTLHPIFI